MLTFEHVGELPEIEELQNLPPGQLYTHSRQYTDGKMQVYMRIEPLRIITNNGKKEATIWGIYLNRGFIDMCQPDEEVYLLRCDDAIKVSIATSVPES